MFKPVPTIIPDSEDYFTQLEAIHSLLKTPAPETPSFYKQKPRIELVLVPITKRHWLFWKKDTTIQGIRLITPLIFWSKELQSWVVELAGVTSDGASTPQFVWSLLPPFGRGEGYDYKYAAIGHDKFCRQGMAGISRLSYVQAAGLFREMMIAENVKTRVYRTMYTAVLCLGPRFPAAANNLLSRGRVF